MTMMHMSIERPTGIATSVADVAKLVSLSTSQWAGTKKLTKAQVAELANTAGVDEKFLRGTKSLTGDCPELKAVNTITNSMRTAFYDATLPWWRGWGLLPNVKFMDFHNTMTGLMARREDAVEQFIDRYEWIRAEVEANGSLGSFFSMRDYPTVDEMRRKFRAELMYAEVPTNDIRTAPGEEAKQILHDYYTNAQKSLVEEATSDMWARTHKLLTSLVSSLTVEADGKRGRIYESTFDSVQGLIDGLRDFNLTGDASMEAARQKLEAALNGVGLDALKESDSKREEVKENLQAVLDSLPSIDL